ncbi:hypothetical protein BD309DRAFT_1049240 [Dichomitus squalens]|nr:hypothetical protein BD309DRAFT_1049240 [Dichomitus squalens]
MSGTLPHQFPTGIDMVKSMPILRAFRPSKSGRSIYHHGNLRLMSCNANAFWPSEQNDYLPSRAFPPVIYGLRDPMMYRIGRKSP